MQQSRFSERFIAAGLYPFDGSVANSDTTAVSAYVRDEAEKHFTKMAARASDSETFPRFIMHGHGEGYCFTAALDEHGGKWLNPSACVDLARARG